MLSIVVTLYNAQAEIDFFHQQLLKYLKQASFRYECIFVDNGSHDATLLKLRHLCEKDFHCQYISMQHNISTMETLFIGAKFSKGDHILLMDIEHPCYMITKLYEMAISRKAICVGGMLHNPKNDLISKKQLLFKLFTMDAIANYMEEEDYDGFKSFIHRSNHEDVMWIPYTNLERQEERISSRIVKRLNLRYERRSIYMMLIAFAIVLLILPLTLILYYDLSEPYSLYISFLLALCLLAVIEVSHSRFCCFHISKRIHKIKETTLL